MDRKSPISLAVTAVQLERLTFCAYRMLSYADPGESLLIATFQAENGTPVRLVLDKRCLSRSPPFIIAHPTIIKKIGGKEMNRKIKTVEAKKKENETCLNQVKAKAAEAVSVLKNTSGANHSTEVLIGVVTAVVIGLLVLNAYTGFFNTLWSLVTGKITGMFS